VLAVLSLGLAACRCVPTVQRVEPPRLVLSPQRLSLGAVYVGQMATGVVSAVNEGGAPADTVMLRTRVLRQRGLSLLLGAVAVQALAFVIWVLDLKRIVCAPESLRQGHAAWHLLGAVASVLLWRALRA